MRLRNPLTSSGSEIIIDSDPGPRLAALPRPLRPRARRTGPHHGDRQRSPRRPRQPAPRFAQDPVESHVDLGAMQASAAAALPTCLVRTKPAANPAATTSRASPIRSAITKWPPTAGKGRSVQMSQLISIICLVAMLLVLRHRKRQVCRQVRPHPGQADRTIGRHRDPDQEPFRPPPETGFSL